MQWLSTRFSARLDTVLAWNCRIAYAFEDALHRSLLIEDF